MHQTYHPLIVTCKSHHFLFSPSYERLKTALHHHHLNFLDTLVQDLEGLVIFLVYYTQTTHKSHHHQHQFFLDSRVLFGDYSKGFQDGFVSVISSSPRVFKSSSYMSLQGFLDWWFWKPFCSHVLLLIFFFKTFLLWIFGDLLIWFHGCELVFSLTS